MPISDLAVVDTTHSSPAIQICNTMSSVPVQVKIVVRNFSTIGIVPPSKANSVVS